jgi:hypothetical protein
MEQGFAQFPGGMVGKNLAPKLTETRKPRTQIAGNLLIDLAAQLLGERGALPRSGNGDLQVTATHNCAEKEIAIGDVVYTVAEYVSLNCAAINSRIHFRRTRGGENNKMFIEVGDFEASLNPFEPPLGDEFANFTASFGSNNAKPQSSFE